MKAKKLGHGCKLIERNGRDCWVIEFRYDLRDASGKKNGQRGRYRRDATIQTKEHAAREAIELMARAVETGSPFDPATITKAADEPASALKLADFYADDFAKLYMPGYRKATRVRYEALWRQRMRDFGGHRALSSFTTMTYREYHAELSKAGVKVKGPLNFLRTLLRAAEGCGKIATAPVFPKGLIPSQKRKVGDPPEPEEIDKLIASPAPDGNDWIILAELLAFDAGLRSGEVRALEVRDIRFAAHKVDVVRAFSEDELCDCKDGDERSVYMTARLEARLREACTGKLPRARLVVLANGETPTRQRILTVLYRHMRLAGVSATTFHRGRHAFITELLRVGANPEAVRLMSGHDSLEDLQPYAHATERDKRSAVAALRR